MLEGQYTRESASLQNNYRSDKNRQVKNGGSGEGRWCEREFQEEVGEEPAKVSWTQRKNGRGMVDEKSRCSQSVEGEEEDRDFR